MKVHDVVWLRRNPWMTALSFFPRALALAAIVATAVTNLPFVMMAPHLAIVGLIAVVGTFRRMPYPVREETRAFVDGDGLHLGDVVIPKKEIAKAELVPTIAAPTLHVVRRGDLGEMRIAMRGEDAAHELLTALGFAASQTSATYKIRSLATVRKRWAAVFLIPLAFVAAVLLGPQVAPFAMPMALVLALMLFVKRTTFTVGADALLVRWLWVRELIAMNDVETFKRFEVGFGNNRVHGIEVMLRDGKTIKLPMSDEQRPMIAQRITDAMEFARSGEHARDEALVLARGELDVRAWIGKLKAIGLGATASLRTQAVLPEVLWRVASDASQPASSRAAAAVALAPTLDETSRVRLGEIAKTTVAPKLRVALERAAEDADDASLEEALRDVIGHA